MLKSFKLRATLFNKILESFDCYTEYHENLFDYLNGYQDKQIIRYNETRLICTESHLNYLNLLEDDELEYTDWLQVVIELDNEATTETVQKDVTGLNAWCEVHKNLQRYYKKDEIKDILNSYQTEYDHDLIQQHITPSERGIKRYDNCIYYDINGAHNYLLTEMFPKAKEYFEKLYNERKIKPRNKKIANYFVGMLNTTDKEGKFNRYPGAYNHIVQSVTGILNPAVLEVMGKTGTVVYENTDGFIVENPGNYLEASTELGKFKIEAQGTVYTYVDKNYWCLEYTDIKGNRVLKGNVLNSVRDMINLSKGEVVHYDKVRNEYHQFVAVNIIKEKL